MQIYVDILVQLHAEMTAVEDVKTLVKEVARGLIALGHVDLFAAVDALVTARMDVKQDVKILALMVVVHVVMNVLMRVQIVLVHADNRAALDAKVVAKAVVKQIALMIVLLIVLRLVEEHVLELMDLRVVQHKTLLQTIQEVKYLQNKPFLLLGNNSLK